MIPLLDLLLPVQLDLIHRIDSAREELHASLTSCCVLLSSVKSTISSEMAASVLCQNLVFSLNPCLWSLRLSLLCLLSTFPHGYKRFAHTSLLQGVVCRSMTSELNMRFFPIPTTSRSLTFTASSGLKYVPCLRSACQSRTG